MTLSRGVLITWCCGLLAVQLVSGYQRNYALYRLDDDRMFYYYTGVQLGRSELGANANEAVADSMRDAGVSTDQQFRWQIKSDYRRNYLMSSVAYRVGAGLVKQVGFPDYASRYPSYLAVALVSGFGLSFGVAALMLLVGVAWIADTRLAVGATLALTLIAVAEVMWMVSNVPFRGSDGLVAPGGFSLILAQIDVFVRGTTFLLMNPHSAFSPFGDTARNHYMLLALLVFIYRWAGRHTTAYAVLLVLSLVHLSFTGLLLGFVAATDVVLRPQVLLQRGVALLVGGTVVLFLSREVYLDTVIGVNPRLIALVLGVGVVAWVGLRRWSATARWPRVARLRARALSLGDPTADLLVFGLLWVAMLVVAYVATQLQLGSYGSGRRGRSPDQLRVDSTAGNGRDVRLTCQPVAKAPLHSTGAASLLTSLLLGQILAGILPRRALSTRRIAHLGATRGFTTGWQRSSASNRSDDVGSHLAARLFSMAPRPSRTRVAHRPPHSRLRSPRPVA